MSMRDKVKLVFWILVAILSTIGIINDIPKVIELFMR